MNKRQWLALAVGALILAAVAVPGLLWLLSPGAGIPAFPGTTAPSSETGPAADSPGIPPAGTSEGAAGTQPPGTQPPATSLEPPTVGERVNGRPETPAVKPAVEPTVEPAGEPAVPATATVPGGKEPEPGQMVWPVAGKVLVPFGFRYSDTYGDWRLHPGLQLAAAPGEAVKAAAAGKVASVAQRADKTWEVTVVHGGKLVTTYGGMIHVVVKQGQAVAAGQKLGGMPAAAAPLDFHVQAEGAYDDPGRWLRPR